MQDPPKLQAQNHGFLMFPANPLSFCRNVDGLHQAAGSSADLVVEVHGSTQDMDRNLDDSAGIFGNFIFDL